jgi:hypothetical protein
MKTTKLSLLILSLSATALLISGCGAKEETSTTSTEAVQPPATTDNTTAAASQAAADVQAQASPAKAQADAAMSQATNAAAEGQADIMTLITRVKDQVAKKQYAEAMVTVKELSSKPLSSEQQTWLSQIKAEIQKGLSSDAMKSIGRSLPGTK